MQISSHNLLAASQQAPLKAPAPRTTGDFLQELGGTKAQALQAAPANTAQAAPPQRPMRPGSQLDIKI